jgi:hypothetical protein
MTSAHLRAADIVVLLHGLGLGGWAMARLERSLRAEGFRTVNLTYPSRTLSLEQLAAEWLPAQLRARGIAAAPRVHFVTHSMGGIVLRAWLREEQRKNDGRPPAGLGRVVMLAPPNQGSAVADRLRRFPPFRWFTGVNGARLGTGANSVPRALGPWDRARRHCRRPHAQSALFGVARRRQRRQGVRGQHAPRRYARPSRAAALAHVAAMARRHGPGGRPFPATRQLQSTNTSAARDAALAAVTGRTSLS